MLAPETEVAIDISFKAGVAAGRRQALIEVAEIADCVADDRDAMAIAGHVDHVAMYRAAEDAAKTIAAYIRKRLDEA